jgi:KaiC/GvpD/RAD55 family RecA-like ATPase
MSEDRTSDSRQQGGGDSTDSRNQRSVNFINAFLSEEDAARLWLAGSVPGLRTVRPVGMYTEEKLRKLPVNERHHIAAGLYKVADSRADINIETVPFVVFDDIGRKVAAPDGATPITHGIEIDMSVFDHLPEPSWKTETSAGRFQYGFHFNPPLPPDIARKVLAALKQHPLLGKGIHSLGQYFRLPTGTNTKPSGGSFPTRLVSLGPSYTLDAFVSGFSLDLDAPEVASQGSGQAAGERCSVETVEKILSLLDPNEPPFKDRIDWTRAAHAVHGATGDEGRDVFIAWCGRYTGKINPGGAEKMWDTLPESMGSATTLRKLVEERYGPDTPEIKQVQQWLAGDAFEEVKEETIRRARNSLQDLLARARKMSPTPQRHQADDYRHWLDGDGLAEDAFGLATKTQVAAPSLFSPYTKGVVTMLAGPPGKGKSALMLAQAAAVALNRKDLIRDGLPRLQFPGDVFYVSNEDSRSVVNRRLAGFARNRRIDLTKARKHGFYAVSSALLSKKGDATAVECLSIVEAMVRHIEGGGKISLLVVDTMPASIVGFEENSAKEMMEVMALLKQIASAFWCAVVFIHHGTKAGWDNGDRSLAAAARGTGALVGSVRGAVLLTDPTDEERKRYVFPDDRRIVAEYVLKASDGRQGYVACFYELVEETVDVEDAEVEGVVISETVPVLVPFVARMMFQDEDQSVAWHELLMSAQKAGRTMWRVGRGAKEGSTGPESVHRVLGVTIERAFDIVSEFEGRGWVRIDRIKDTNRNWKDAVVVLERPVF